MRRDTFLLTLLIFLISLPIFGADARGRGYTSRACGFDLDDDFVYGEANDCTVCDGNPSTGAFTVDPDGDTTEEDINFVDSATGVDDASCGAPNDPCATIGYVLAGSNSSYTKYADGAGDGAEDIICISGTFDENTLTLPAGVAGTKEESVGQVPTNGTYQFTYPTDPAMLVGWDKDMDGSYPPHDTDDTAVIDGTSAGNGSGGNVYAVGFSNYGEIAHVRFTNWYEESDTTNAVQVVKHNNSTYAHVHDFTADDINRSGCNGPFTAFTVFGQPSYYAIENGYITDSVGRLIRNGSSGGPEVYGPWRVRNIEWYGWPKSTTDTACAQTSDAGNIFMSVWGYGADTMDIFNNIFDALDNTWTGTPVGAGTYNFVVLKQCAQKVRVTNNYAEDAGELLTSQGSDNVSCSSGRRTTDIVMANNESVQSQRNGDFLGISLSDPSDFLTNANQNIWVYNNVMYDKGSAQFSGCFTVSSSQNIGAPNQDIRVYNNTCVSKNGLSGTNKACFYSPGMNRTYDLATYYVKNNICYLTGGSSEQYIKFYASDPTIDFDYNVYGGGAGGTYRWNGGSNTDFATWKTNTSQDANSKECNPQFIDYANNDFQLADNDTCAKGAGADLSSAISDDYFGDARPQDGTWDIGFDEEASGAGPPPTTTKCCSG